MRDFYADIQEQLYRRTIDRKIAVVNKRSRVSRVKLLAANALALIPSLVNLGLLGGGIYVLTVSKAWVASLIFVIPAVLLALMPLGWLFRKDPKEKQWTRREQPELFAELDKLSQAVSGSRIDTVAVVKDFNASIERRGFRTILNVVVPLAALLTEEELHAIICHECGHLARDLKSPADHLLISYCLGTLHYWSRTLTDSLRLEEGAGLMRPLFFAAVKLFDFYAYLILLLTWHESLLSELLADRLALRATSREDAVSALRIAQAGAEAVEDCLSDSVMKRVDFPEHYLKHARGKAEAWKGYESHHEEIATTHPLDEHRIRSLQEPGERRFLEATQAVLSLVRPLYREVLESVKEEYDYHRSV